MNRSSEDDYDDNEDGLCAEQVSLTPPLNCHLDSQIRCIPFIHLHLLFYPLSLRPPHAFLIPPVLPHRPALNPLLSLTH
ncbi:hypothetical protein FGO68_gene10703 [Halteria grandinella]|uniref:Uncharacterized protein n=1 Tax=Halteria grandinella TaxID=5974 RepID=A0A8J8NML7_HALGN|nr:hypothetical protein FGO68_gene10703 [Halteria grandinella]